MNQDDNLFSPRTLVALILIAGIGLIGMVAMQVFSDALVPQRSAGANSYSYSAIGHRGIVETLRRSGRNVVVSRYSSARKAGLNGILILAEPRLQALTGDLMDALPAAANVLVILPKWHGHEDAAQPDWLKTVEALPADYVREVLVRMTGLRGAEVLRRETARPTGTGEVQHTPVAAGTQLFRSSRVSPVIGYENGLLLGKFGDVRQTVWVLSDPDIMNNHGLSKANNAALFAQILDTINPGASALVFDETIHGLERKPSLWYAVLEFPFVVVTFSCAAAILFFLWASVGRFGSPLPAPPPIKFGKADLIANTAKLLRAGGYGAHVLERYAEATIRDVAERLHCPHGVSGIARLRWLDQIAEARGVGERIVAIGGQVEAIAHGRQTTATVAATARQIYRWKQEMLHES